MSKKMEAAGSNSTATIHRLKAIISNFIMKIVVVDNTVFTLDVMNSCT
jgi:hypothetical protein